MPDPDPQEPPAPPEPPPGDGPELHDAPIPGASREMVFAVAIGLLFVGAALASLFLLDIAIEGLPKLFLMLLMATGIALVVAAFGGRATVKVRSAIFAGATATMFAILAVGSWWLDRESSANRISVLSGRISGLDWEAFSPLLKFRDYAPSYLDRQSDEFRFVAFRSDLTTAEASLLLAPKDGSEALPVRIPVACFNPYLGGDLEIDWEFDAANRLVRDKRDGRRIIGGEPLAEGVELCRTQIEAGAFSPPAFPALVGEARAQGFAPLDPAVRDRALKELASPDPEIRRTARDVLANGAPQDVATYMAFLRADASGNADIRLGVTVALTEMLRRDKGQRDAVAQALTRDDKATLIEFAGSADRTLRIYATEFLFDLADPEAAEMALARAADTNDANARFNWILSAQDGWARLPAERRQALAPLIARLRELTRNAPKTFALLTKLT